MLELKYREIKQLAIGKYNCKGSKFIAYAVPVRSEVEIKEKLDQIKKKEKKARHFCYAYILNNDKFIQKVNDDGEPSSSAGKPILNQILSYNLTNILIVVCRYFGGTKLGIPGLIKAYKKSSENALSNSLVITHEIKDKYEIIFKYNEINLVMKIIKKYNLEIINLDTESECKLIFAVARNKKNILKQFTKNYQLKINTIR